MARFGKLDILVNNAGLKSTSVPDPMDTDGWRRIMEVNATGVFRGTKYAIPAMQRAGGGAIVNISSIMGFVGGGGGHPAYHASKGAVRIFTKATAVQYGPNGIPANSVHPGFMPPMRSSHPDPEAREEQVQITPLRRIGKPLEVAYGVLFLVSDECRLSPAPNWSSTAALSPDREDGTRMTDALGWRAKFGACSHTNTIVEPDFYRMSVPGVIPHFARIHIRDQHLGSDAAFEALLEQVREEIGQAVARVLTASQITWSWA